MLNNRNQILEWAESNQFESQNLEQALKLAEAEPQPTDWINFAKTMLVWSAMLSLCCGVVFFFAYNWQDLSRFTKFALVESVMLIATLVYVRLALTPLSITVSLMAMTLFTGALLALVGQTYQTGADPWQLFATWAVLILPWAIIARASSLWLLWAGLVNLSGLLFLEISHGMFGLLFSDEVVLWIFALLNTALLFFFEVLVLIKKPATGNRYLNTVLALAAGMATTLLAIWAIFETEVGLTGFVYYVIWIAVAFYLYRYKLRDLFVVSMGCLSVITITVSLLIKLIDNAMDDGGFLVVSFAIIGLSTLAGIWLKKLAQQFSLESAHDNSNSEVMS